MRPERWQQIEKLYYAARKRDPGQRAAFLDQACAGDEALRREVESLLESDAQASDFLAIPALRIAAEEIAEAQSHSLGGQQLGLEDELSEFRRERIVVVSRVLLDVCSASARVSVKVVQRTAIDALARLKSQNKPLAAIYSGMRHQYPSSSDGF